MGMGMGRGSVVSIIIGASEPSLPFYKAETQEKILYITKHQGRQQGRHTNVLKTYDAVPTNQFIFSKHLFWVHSRKWPSFQ